MMISPDYYISRFIDSSYEELMTERDRLVKSTGIARNSTAV